MPRAATADAAPDALPYHWLELGEMLLDAAADDIPDADAVRRAMRDLREVRLAKLRMGIRVLDGGREVKMNGVGGMEIAEGRGFIVGVVDGLRYAFFLLLLSSIFFFPVDCRRWNNCLLACVLACIHGEDGILFHRS